MSVTMVFAAVGLAQTQPTDEFRCLLPGGCGPVVDDEAGCRTPGGCVPDDELRCLLPDGCDTNGDGAPDLRAGKPAPGGGAGGGAGNVQYGNAY